jgi:SMI1 / KNR4 family (SUKH-1)
MTMIRTIEAAPATSENAIKALESKVGFRFPDSYRVFLLLRNGGRPERDLVRVPGCDASPVARVHFFFGVDDPIESCNLAWNIKLLPEQLPRHSLPIATTEGADIFILMLDTGQVAFWDDYQKKVFPLATSFDEFIGSLYRDNSSPRLTPQ